MASSDKKSGRNNDNSAKSELIKRYKANPFVFIGTIIVLIIVIIAFVLVPAIVPDASGASLEKVTFGRWDKKPIAYTGNNYFSKMRDQFSRYAEVYRMNDYQVWLYAYQSTVVRTAILDIMKKSKYQPPTEFIDKLVAELPDFQENGRFSSVRYKQVDPARRLTMWQDMRNDATANRYIEDISGIVYSSQEADFIGSLTSNQRRFKLTYFPYSNYPDSEVLAFAEKKPDLFRVLKLSQISINTDALDAQKVRDTIQNGTSTFEDVARSQSEDIFAERGGDAGSRYFFELGSLIPDEIERRALLGLSKGALSSIYKTSSGWVFFRAEDAAQAPDLSDKAALAEIRDYMIDSERGTIEDWLVAQAESFSERARTVSFEAAAAGRNLEIYEFGPLPINYGDSGLFATLSSFDAPNLEAAASNENFWRIAWTTRIGQPSAPIILNGNQSSIVVICPVEEIASDETAAENSKAGFLSYWAENEKTMSIENAIITSSKFSDNFFSTYMSLFGFAGLQ